MSDEKKPKVILSPEVGQCLAAWRASLPPKAAKLFDDIGRVPLAPRLFVVKRGVEYTMAHAALNEPEEP